MFILGSIRLMASQPCDDIKGEVEEKVPQNQIMDCTHFREGWECCNCHYLNGHRMSLCQNCYKQKCD
jgi:hypothetical protein